MEPVSSNPETQAMYEMFERGYDAGIEDVLINLVEFCCQGGVITQENVEEWIATYEKENV